MARVVGRATAGGVLQVGQHRAGPMQEVGEAGVAGPDKAPHEAQDDHEGQHQPEQHVGREEGVLVINEVDDAERADEREAEQHMEEADREVPDEQAFHGRVPREGVGAGLRKDGEAWTGGLRKDGGARAAGFQARRRRWVMAATRRPLVTTYRIPTAGAAASLPAVAPCTVASTKVPKAEA